MGIERLPDELLQNICLHLSVVDVFALDRTCRRLAAAKLWSFVVIGNITPYIFTTPSQTLARMACLTKYTLSKDAFKQLCKRCCFHPVFVRHILQDPQWNTLIVETHIINYMGTHLAQYGTLRDVQGYFHVLHRHGLGKNHTTGYDVLAAVGKENPFNVLKLKWVFEVWDNLILSDFHIYTERLIIALLQFYPEKIQLYHVYLFHRACRQAERNLIPLLQINKRTVQTIETAKNLCHMVRYYSHDAYLFFKELHRLFPHFNTENLECCLRHEGVLSSQITFFLQCLK